MNDARAVGDPGLGGAPGATGAPAPVPADDGEQGVSLSDAPAPAADPAEPAAADHDSTGPTELAAAVSTEPIQAGPASLAPALVDGPGGGDPGASPSRPTGHARIRGIRFALGFVFGMAAVLAVSVGGLSAFEQQYAGRVLPGVRVGDVDLSGLTASQATARLAEAHASVGEGTLVLVGAGLSIAIPIAELRRPDIEGMTAGAMAVGRAGTPFERIVGNAKTAVRGVVLEPQLVIDAAAIERAVSAFSRSVDRAPVDARVELGAQGYRVVPGTDGRATDWRGLLEEATAALQLLDLPTEVVLEAQVTTVPPVVTTGEAEVALEQANRMVADIAIADIVQTWTLPADQVRSWIAFEPTGDGSYRAVAKPAGLDANLAEMAAAILRPPTDAAYLFGRDGKIVGASESHDGRSLDGPATVDAIAALLAQRAAGQAAAGIAPVVTIVKPQITTEQATATAPLMQKLSEWTTYFPIGERNGFGANIWIPALDIDGYVLPNGALFDFWRAIGPVTRARGYRDGGAIIGGRTEPQGALAGGICSTSTTLFNAAMRAGLPMLARRNHYYYINRYPLGLDATVFQSSSGSVQTMSFRNDTGYPILIRGYKIRDGNDGYVKFEIYGVPTGRTVTIGPEVVKNIRKAADTVQYTSTLPAGRRSRLEAPADGKDVWRTITVRDASGTVLRTTTYYSHYARVNGLTLIGTGGSSG